MAENVKWHVHPHPGKDVHLFELTFTVDRVSVMETPLEASFFWLQELRDAVRQIEREVFDEQTRKLKRARKSK